MRKPNSKRKHSPLLAESMKSKRKNIEISFSALAIRFPKFIHAVTERDFNIKVFSLFLLMYFLAYLVGHNLGTDKLTARGL